MEYITRGVCGQEGCRERRYYLDNGLWFCRRGHQQEGQQVEEDPDDFGTHGKANRVKKAVSEKAQKTYRGRQAYGLFLQAYQLVLWKQCHAFVHGQGFPAEFENVVRDLWALRLSSFSEKISDDDGDAEPELFSSQPAATQESQEAPKLSGKYVEWPRLIDSIALCYLGSFLMRLPVNVQDIYRMVMREEVPFVRVIKSIPREMRDKLPQEYLSLLETKSLLKAEHLHNAVMDVALLYHHKFGLEFPPLNSPPLLFRYIKRLALPVEIYPAVFRLQKLAGFSFSYPTTIVGKKRSLNLPELQVMTLIVISTKLLFPFDDLERYPVSSKEPTSQVINWELWAQVQRHFDNRETAGGRIGKGNEIQVKEADVFNMTSSQLDEYMDWYENSWLDGSRGMRQSVLINYGANIFPARTQSIGGFVSNWSGRCRKPTRHYPGSRK
ncbi:hypothetical protein AWENTII_001562 [Aspergillus wentii]